MMDTNKTSRPLAFVTGASSGIGRAFAERLAHDGYDLTVVARRGDKLEQLAKHLHDTHGVRLDVLAADLGKAADRRLVEKRLEQADALEVLVNSAGFGAYMPFLQLDPDRAEELINVQVLAVARLTRLALPGMIARRKGVIINVSSRFAFSAAMDAPSFPKRATYVGTKTFINAFTQLLAIELQGTGVQVQALCPAVVLTEFHTRQGIDPKRFPPEIVMQAEDVVAASLAALKTGEVICLPGLDDPAVLQQVWDSQRKLLEHSGSGKVSKRYAS
jgi:short-subunit dehydrogenase